MKLTKIACAFAALAVVGIGTAQAESFASASIQITNFKWLLGSRNDVTPGRALINGQDITVTAGGSNTGSAGNALNGVNGTPVNFTSPILTGGAIPLQSICQGPDCGPNPPNPGPPANTDPNNKNYVYADFKLSGAVIDIPLASVTAGVTATLMAQADLTAHQYRTGLAASNEGANTNITVVATNTFVSHFVLDYSVDLLANVVAPYGVTDSARAKSDWALYVYDITDPDQSHLDFTFAPTNLTRTIGVSAGDPMFVWSRTGTNVRSDDITLDAGGKYQFVIGSNVQADASHDVSEPDALAVFGLGLVGLVASSLRKKKA